MSSNPEIQLPSFMTPGWKAEIGKHTFDPAEIIKFATAFDPQPFHLSEEAAKNSVFGGLCASGWHTVSIWMRKQRDHHALMLSEHSKSGLPLPEFGPSPGFTNLKWLRPVFAGDTITYFNETVSCRPSKSKPGWYVLKAIQSGINQRNEPVMTFESVGLLKYPA